MMGDWFVYRDYNRVRTPAEASQLDRDSDVMDGDRIVVIVKLCTV